MRIWDEHCAFSRDFGQKVTYIEAISAIDIALWNIAGQAAGLPIWKLLGGRFRDSVTAFTQHRGALLCSSGSQIFRLSPQGTFAPLERAGAIQKFGSTVAFLNQSKGGPQEAQYPEALVAELVLWARRALRSDNAASPELPQSS